MNQTGQAAVFTSPAKTFRLATYPVLEPKEQQVLLKLQRSGICGTDLHIYRGKLGMPDGDCIIGHEFIGSIQKLGQGAAVDGLGQKLEVGNSAIACVAIPCGRCVNCKKGETASCMSFGVTYAQSPAQAPHFFGGFSEYLHSPAANLVRIPDGLDLDAVAAAPCGGPTVIRAFTYGGGVNPGELVVVQGTGALGVFAVAWAVAHGAHVVAIGDGDVEVRRKMTLELGAEEFISFRNTTREERLAHLQELAKKYDRGNGVDLVIETSGAPNAVPEGMDLVRTRGRYLIPGQYSCSGSIEIQPQLITFKAIQMIGSGQYTMQDIGTYLDFLQQHPAVAAIFARCVTHKFKVAQIDEAIRVVGAGQAIKAVFTL